MPQVSKYPLHTDLKREVFRVFWDSMAQLRSAAGVSEFLSDLLSDTEEMMLAKRFAVALLILRGKKPVDIATTLHVSFSTIRSVDSWMNRASPATMAILDRVVATQAEDNFWDAVEATLDKLQPRWGTDWSAAGKAKWQRTKERSARASLR